MDMQFKTKMAKIGAVSSYIIVPKPIADILDKDKEYIFLIKEVENNAEHN